MNDSKDTEELVTATEDRHELALSVPDHLGEGRYSNHVLIRHTAEEFIMDFTMILPPEARLVARVLLNPSHTKRLHDAIGSNIEKYEEKFGEIIKETPSPDESSSPD